MNCQSVSDCRGRILDISIKYGGSSSDCRAFEASELHTCLENGLMKQDGENPRFVLFGDNAYLNTSYMATPFTNVSGDPNRVSEDAYNFYHSQLRIRVECAFGIMVQRWGILRSAMPRNLSIAKIVALVNALAKLHNFCINETDNYQRVPQMLHRDCSHMMNQRTGYVGLSMGDQQHDTAVPEDLLHNGEHFHDVSDSFIREHRRRNQTQQLPRTHLHLMIAEGHWERPIRMNFSARRCRRR